jgi:hypothetical protein
MTDDRRNGLAEMLERIQADAIAQFTDALALVDHVMPANKRSQALVVALEQRLIEQRRRLLEDLRGVAAVVRDDGEPR